MFFRLWRCELVAARVRSKNRNGSLPAKFLVHIIMMSQHNNRQSPSKQATRPNTPLQSHRSHLLFLPIIIASVMLIFGITKLINKTLAPKLLSLGLRLHDISPSSSSSGLIMPLLLPLAQKLVSIEVRDDYRNLARSMMTMMQGEDGGGGGRGGGERKTTAWDDFVDGAWDLLFVEDRNDGRRGGRPPSPPSGGVVE